MRAGALVAATRDRDELLDQIVQLVVPTLADYCVVFLPTADGTLLASALGHTDPAQATLLAELRAHPIAPAGPLLSQRAYTTGTTQLSRDVAAEMPAWARAEPDAIDIVKLMRPRSAIGTPLLAGQHPLGVIALYRGAGRPPFTETDVSVVEELGRRLAVGLANTDTFAREHAIAETLQRSLLPDALPQIPGLDLAVRYLPATEGAAVGGDWYDAFPLADGRVGLVIGDVAGHNIASASTMGQVRSLLRAYAIDNPDPGGVLQRTNAAVAQLLPEALASVVYAVLDPATGDLAYANAGHPPPIITTGAGQAEYLDDATGTMLGACATASYTTGHRRLPPGARLLCYTDGLIEDRRRDISEGLAALAETLRRSGPRLGREPLTHNHSWHRRPKRRVSTWPRLAGPLPAVNARYSSGPTSQPGAPLLRLTAESRVPAGTTADTPGGDLTTQTSGEHEHRIVVGVDGSDPSKAALAWAIRQGGLTGATVEAVIAWELPVNYGTPAPLIPPRTDFEEAAREVITLAIADVSSPDEQVTIKGKVVEGNAPRILLDASAGADLLVVGSRGHGGFVEALLGSVGQHCVHHATCPVVVIRDSVTSG